MPEEKKIFILTCAPDDTAARDAITEWRKLGAAQKAFFDYCGDDFVNMMDNNSPGMYEESLHHELGEAVRTQAARMLRMPSDVERFEYPIGESPDRHEKAISVFSHPFERPEDIYTSLGTVVHFEPPDIHPTLFSTASVLDTLQNDTGQELRSRKNLQPVIIEVNSQAKRQFTPLADESISVEQTTPEGLNTLLMEKMRRTPQVMLAT